MLDLEFAELSDPGRVRDHNEDAFGHVRRDARWLFVLADGVGGHDRGEVASRIAVDTLMEVFPAAGPNDNCSVILPKAIEHANLRVYEAGMATTPGGSSMATTVVACLFRFDRVCVAHVGDSRCYLIRNGRAASLTRDHTLSGEQLRMGLITSREAAVSQTSHILSRSVGAGMFVNIDVVEEQIFPDDCLLLCSDGLHNSVGTQDLISCVRTGRDLQECAAELVNLAKERDGSDNITVQLIRIREVERVGMYRGRHYKLR